MWIKYIMNVEEVLISVCLVTKKVVGSIKEESCSCAHKFSQRERKLGEESKRDARESATKNGVLF